jgi:hypothetical protein
MDQGLYNNPGLTPQWGDQQQLGGGGQGYGGYAMQGIQSLAAMYGAYNARNMQKLSKKQFGFEVGSANRNLSNQAVSYNNDIDNRTRMGLALNGIQQGNPEYEQRMLQAQQGYVDGSPIRG